MAITGKTILNNDKGVASVHFIQDASTPAVVNLNLGFYPSKVEGIIHDVSSTTEIHFLALRVDVAGTMTWKTVITKWNTAGSVTTTGTTNSIADYSGTEYTGSSTDASAAKGITIGSDLYGAVSDVFMLRCEP